MFFGVMASHGGVLGTDRSGLGRSPWDRVQALSQGNGGEGAGSQYEGLLSRESVGDIHAGRCWAPVEARR
jgi:hypothetical protein